MTYFMGKEQMVNPEGKGNTGFPLIAEVKYLSSTSFIL